MNGPVSLLSAGPTTDSRRARRFAWGLAAIALGGFALRVAVAWWFHDHTIVRGDGIWYIGVARQLASGDGFVEPLTLITTKRHVASASHPPLYPVLLSAIDFAGTDSILVHRLWSSVAGAATVVVLGLLGRDLAGPRAGLLAAGLGAVYVDLLVQDVLLWSEGLFAMLVVLSLWLAYRFLRRPGVWRAALLAGAITLATLTRAEAGLLYLVLLVPLVLRARDLSVKQRLAGLGVGAAVACALFAPWLVYNNAGRFERPVVVSTGLGGLIGSANCASTYSGPLLGGWGGYCAEGLPDRLPTDETEAEVLFREAGLRYAREHKGRLPVVVPVRVLRSFGFWRPASTTAGDLQLQEAQIGWARFVAVAQYWAYLGIAIAGVWMLRRRQVPLWPLLTPALLVAFISVLGYGTMRFRVAFEVVLPVLAAVAIEAWWRRASGRRGDVGPEPGSAMPVAGTLGADS